MDVKVCYEVSFDGTKASLLRYAQVLLKLNIEHVRSYGYNPSYPRSSITALIKMAPHHLEVFKRELKPIEVRYRSPTRFDHGTLRPIYASAEEEVAHAADA